MMQIQRAGLDIQTNVIVGHVQQGFLDSLFGNSACKNVFAVVNEYYFKR